MRAQLTRRPRRALAPGSSSENPAKIRANICVQRTRISPRSTCTIDQERDGLEN
jgi:hypothetical protein